MVQDQRFSCDGERPVDYVYGCRQLFFCGRDEIFYLGSSGLIGYDLLVELIAAGNVLLRNDWLSSRIVSEHFGHIAFLPDRVISREVRLETLRMAPFCGSHHSAACAIGDYFLAADASLALG